MIGLQATTCGTRQLSKVKRFLTTLQQFGSDISPEAGERVRGLIFNLVNGTLSIDDFHHKLQDTTNFPLRPFVIPFLKANLPLLQREIVQCARAAKQTPQQFLHHHEHLVLDPAHSPTESTSGDLLFHHHSSTSMAAEMNENGKRRLSERHKDNGHMMIDSSNQDIGPPHKRHHHTLLSPPLAHPASSNTLGLSHRLDDLPLSSRDYRDRDRDRLNFERDYRHYGFSPRDMLMDERENEEEWKSIHTMLNCILGMVEKTKRALAILQHRSLSDRQELAMWIRRHAEGTADSNLKKQPGEMLMKETDDRVSEVKRKVEEAVNEVKRQAVVELQKAVTSAEVKAREMVASERGKMEKLLMEARIQAAEEALSVLNQQADSNEACWNCGRKASETCSGCNNARYCGAFCQHKDWENHHLVCGQGGRLANSTTTAAAVVATSSALVTKPAQSTTSTTTTSVSTRNTRATMSVTSDSKLIINDVVH
ncbi:core-binding factor, runt domain, alpha subunit 2 [Chamberlinius hualienensis]